MSTWLSLIVGLVAGSFANVCIWRLPLDESVVFPRSHCPACGRTLSALQNIPVVSFLVLGGRCSYCRSRIAWQYPLVELAMAVLFVFHDWRFAGFFSQIVVADLLGFYLLTISIIDYRHRIIPDELSLSLAALGLLLSFANPYLAGPWWMKLLHSLGAGLLGGSIMLAMAWAGEKAFKKEALGGGDVKLIAATGAVLGWSGVFGPLMIGSLSGSVVALALLLMRKKKLGQTLPFGPFLSLGAYVTCLFPGWVVTWVSSNTLP